VTITAPAVPASGTPAVNTTGQNVSVATSGGTATGAYVSYQAAPPVTTPAVPASTVAATNTTGGYVAVAVAGGTVTVIAVSGVTIYTATGNTVIVPPGGTVAITYSVVPTWTWTAVIAGVSQASGALAVNLPVPPGQSVTLIYSAAPTWTWTNPIDLGYTPGYYAENTGAEAAGWNPYTALPYAQHATLGVSGLATGVSN
jgi:hypothetical protein